MPDSCFFVVSSGTDRIYCFAKIENALAYVKDQVLLGNFCEISEVKKGE